MASLVRASNQSTSATSERRRHSSTTARVPWEEVSAVENAHQGATTTLSKNCCQRRRRQPPSQQKRERERGRNVSPSFSLCVPVFLARTRGAQSGGLHGVVCLEKKGKEWERGGKSPLREVECCERKKRESFRRSSMVRRSSFSTTLLFLFLLRSPFPIAIPTPS